MSGKNPDHLSKQDVSEVRSGLREIEQGGSPQAVIQQLYGTHDFNKIVKAMTMGDTGIDKGLKGLGGEKGLSELQILDPGAKNLHQVLSYLDQENKQHPEKTT